MHDAQPLSIVDTLMIMLNRPEHTHTFEMSKAHAALGGRMHAHRTVPVSPLHAGCYHPMHTGESTTPLYAHAVISIWAEVGTVLCTRTGVCGTDRVHTVSRRGVRSSRDPARSRPCSGSISPDQRPWALVVIHIYIIEHISTRKNICIIERKSDIPRACCARCPGLSRALSAGARQVWGGVPSPLIGSIGIGIPPFRL